MSSRKVLRPFVYLLTAHIVSALHTLSLATWAMRGFMRYEELSPREELVEWIVGAILSVTQFPGIQMLGLESDAPSFIATLLTGYLIGLAVGYFAATTVIQPKFTSFIWWLSILIVVTDVICVLVLNGLPKWFFGFSRMLLALVPVTLIAGIVVWLWHRNSMGENGNDG